MRLRSDKILIRTIRGVIKTRALRRLLIEEEQWDKEFAKSINGENRQPVPGINSDHVPAANSDKVGVHLEQNQADARLGQQDEGIDPPEAREVSMPPNRLVTQVGSDTLKRMYVTRGLGKKYGPTPGCPGCATIGKSSPSQSLGHMQEQDAQNWSRVKKAESILPENKHVWMQGNKSNRQATNVLCQRNGIAHQRNSGEWVKRM